MMVRRVEGSRRRVRDMVSGGRRPPPYVRRKSSGTEVGEVWSGSERTWGVEGRSLRG